jgi:hypothetical protein
LKYIDFNKLWIKINRGAIIIKISLVMISLLILIILSLTSGAISAPDPMLENEAEGNENIEIDSIEDSEENSNEGSDDETDLDEYLNPTLEKEYEIEIPLIKSNQEKPYSIKISVEVNTTEPDGDNGSEGFNFDFDIERLEPSYRGTNKEVSITYNNNGVSISRHGPDAGINQATSIEIESRHVSIEINSKFSTGYIPIKD